MIRIMSACCGTLAIGSVRTWLQTRLFLVLFFKCLVFSTDFEALKSSRLPVWDCLHVIPAFPSQTLSLPLPVTPLPRHWFPSLPQYQSLKHREMSSRKKWKEAHSISVMVRNWSPIMYSIIFLVEDFILNLSSLYFAQIGAQFAEVLLNSQFSFIYWVSVWIKPKSQGQVLIMTFFLYRGGKWDTFLRLEPGSGNQLLKMVFEMIFRLSERRLSSPWAIEIGSWGESPSGKRTARLN